LSWTIAPNGVESRIAIERFGHSISVFFHIESDFWSDGKSRNHRVFVSNS